MSEHPSGSDKTGSLEFSPSKLDPRFLSEHFRQNMPVAAQWGYFDHAAVGPLSGPARTALQTFVDQGTRDGDLHWPEWAKGLSGARRAVAAGIGASPSEIAFVANTTEGINLVADGLNWRDGDNLVVPAGEFPSNHYAWRQLSDRGVELRVVPTGAMGEFDPADYDQLLQVDMAAAEASFPEIFAQDAPPDFGWDDDADWDDDEDGR